MQLHDGHKLERTPKRQRLDQRAVAEDVDEVDRTACAELAVTRSRAHGRGHLLQTDYQFVSVQDMDKSLVFIKYLLQTACNLADESKVPVYLQFMAAGGQQSMVIQPTHARDRRFTLENLFSMRVEEKIDCRSQEVWRLFAVHHEQLASFVHRWKNARRRLVRHLDQAKAKARKQLPGGGVQEQGGEEGSAGAGGAEQQPSTAKQPRVKPSTQIKVESKDKGKAAVQAGRGGTKALRGPAHEPRRGTVRQQQTEKQEVVEMGAEAAAPIHPGARLSPADRMRTELDFARLGFALGEFPAAEREAIRNACLDGVIELMLKEAPRRARVLQKRKKGKKWVPILKPIFQDIMLGPEDAEGECFAYEYNSYQRCMLVASKGTARGRGACTWDQPGCAALAALQEQRLATIQNSLPLAFTRACELDEASVLGNLAPLASSGRTAAAATGPGSLKAQCLHMDQVGRPYRQPPPLVIVALQECTVLIVPGSHLWVQAFLAEGDNADEYPWAKQDGRQSPIRLVLKPGQYLIMHGYLIHAGDRAVGGDGQAQVRLALRLHLYFEFTSAQHGTATDTTYPLWHLMPGRDSAKFAAAMSGSFDRGVCEDLALWGLQSDGSIGPATA